MPLCMSKGNHKGYPHEWAEEDLQMSLTIRAATDSDLAQLARMNKELIEDEGCRNPMSVAELEQRMRGWLHGEWQVVLFSERSTVIGYAVYQFRKDEYFPDQTVVYLRQMFVERSQRSQGLGARALRLLAQTRFPRDATVEIDVLATNPRGAKFWSQVGFQPHCTTMRSDFKARQGEASEPSLGKMNP
jgi:GNAT superfamily N-acetyltransferase